jgi:hypothetical protein
MIHACGDVGGCEWGSCARGPAFCGVLMVPRTGQDHLSNVHKLSSWLVMVKCTCCISLYRALEGLGSACESGRCVSGSAPERKVPGCANGYNAVLPGRRTPRPRNAFEVLDAERSLSFLLTAI